MIVDTHVHVFTDNRKNYPQIRDTARAGSIPSITEIGQTEWPLTTTEMLAAMMNEAGVDKATLVQAYFVYEYDNSYTIDSCLKYPQRFASVVVLDPMDPNRPTCWKSRSPDSKSPASASCAGVCRRVRSANRRPGRCGRASPR